MRHSHWILTGTMLLALPALAAAQAGADVRAESRAELRAEVRAETRAERREEARAPQAQARQSTSADAAVDATVAARLPVEPVRRVIAEGRAKGASEATITRAAADAHARLQLSRAVLEAQGDRVATDAEIVAGAEAVARGATRAELARIRDSAPAERSLTTSLQTLTTLQARGVAATDAAARIATRLQGGASDTAITALASGGAAAGGRSTATTATGTLTGTAGGTSATLGGTLGAAASLGGGLIP